MSIHCSGNLRLLVGVLLCELWILFIFCERGIDVEGVLTNVLVGGVAKHF